jgi:hypothetical protein
MQNQLFTRLLIRACMRFDPQHCELPAISAPRREDPNTALLLNELSCSTEIRPDFHLMTSSHNQYRSSFSSILETLNTTALVDFTEPHDPRARVRKIHLHNGCKLLARVQRDRKDSLQRCGQARDRPYHQHMRRRFGESRISLRRSVGGECSHQHCCGVR